MKKKIKKIFLQQKKRYLKKIVGTTSKPRLSVFKSNNHIYAQLIDDQTGHTLAFSSTVSKDLKKEFNSTATQAAALRIGEDIAQKALEKQVTKIVFDRGNYPYHGRIKNLADGARQKGLIF